MNYNEGKSKSSKDGKATWVITAILLAIVVFLFALVVVDDLGDKPKATASKSPTEILIHTAAAGDSSETTAETTARATASAASGATTGLVSENPTTATPTIVPTVAPSTPTPPKEYTFGWPVHEKLPAVDMNYFKDAIFIGDSRMEDFGLFTGTAKHGTFYTKIGLTLNKLIKSDESKLVKFNVDGEKLTLIEALKKNNSFKKAYVMMGYNELGWPGTASFKQYYLDLLNEIRSISPDAIIYVYCVIPVGRTLRDADITVENNTRIAEFNAVIREICAEGQFHYLNVQEVMVDSEGYLPDHASTDGIHPTTEYYLKWLEYTKSHTI